jgi:LysM repeat protein
MMADGISANLNWVRVVFNDQFGWVERSNLDAGEGLDALPQLDVEQTAMQAFHFQTGVGLPVCSQAPSTLAIEGPETVTVELTINGLDIRVGSFLTLQSMGVDGFVMTVQEGRVVLPDESRIEGGQATFFALDEHKDVIGWQQPRPATAEELALGMRVRRTLDALENPPAAAAAPVPVVVEEPTATPIATTSDCAFGPGPVTHRVAAGENLFRIALKYNTSLASIATANGISNVNRIITGSVLTIPNPCSGFVNVAAPPPVSPPPSSSGSTTGSADCSGFRALSPLGGIPYGTADFSWTVVQGASHYRLNIYSANGDRVYSKETPDPSLRYVQTTTAAIGTTSNYSWDADAMYFGQVICTTPRVSGVTRAPAPPFSASWFCSNPGEVTVSYSGVPSGTTSVDIVFDDLVRQSIQGNFPVSGSSGSQSFIRVTTVSFGEVIALPSQQIADLPGSLTCG